MDSVDLAKSSPYFNFVWSASDIPRHPFDSLHPCQSSSRLLDLILQIRSRRPRPQSIPLQSLAIEALSALDARADEDLEIWAAGLAADIFDIVD